MTEAVTRYRAFISYSHRDAETAAWLHRRLETYRIPKHLAGSETALGGVPDRLTPIFRDREELPAATDLSAAVQAALAASDSLIVICSPHAAQSKWVAKEIESFHALHPGRPVLLAIADGDPADCFPDAIRALGAEPLAADLRKSGDGRRLGVLKLVAGITGLPLDRLVQRDAQRRQRRVMAVTLAALAGAVTMAVLLALAVLARSESERQRQQAEGLVEYMLTDLRDKLKGVGRLDVMTAVNERAMAYYGSQGDLERLPPESLERRARILHAMGEDDEKRGNLDLALVKFTEASRTTAALLAKQPDDAERIFTHAQSEFWVGALSYDRKDRVGARLRWQSYRQLAGRLVRNDPRKAEWLKEAGYADGALCSLALEKPVDAQAALASCAAALAWMGAAAEKLANDEQIQLDVASRHIWLAHALKINGRQWEAVVHLRRNLAIVKRLSEADTQNADRKELLAIAQATLAVALLERGQPADRNEAAILIGSAREHLSELDTLDPENRSRAGAWKKVRRAEFLMSEHR